MFKKEEEGEERHELSTRFQSITCIHTNKEKNYLKSIGLESTDRRRFIRLERDLQRPIAERESIQRIDGHERLVVVRHRHEPEAFALLSLKIANDLHVLHSTERSEQLPEDALFRFRSEIVDEDTPADRRQI